MLQLSQIKRQNEPENTYSLYLLQKVPPPRRAIYCLVSQGLWYTHSQTAKKVNPSPITNHNPNTRKRQDTSDRHSHAIRTSHQHLGNTPPKLDRLLGEEAKVVSHNQCHHPAKRNMSATWSRSGAQDRQATLTHAVRCEHSTCQTRGRISEGPPAWPPSQSSRPCRCRAASRRARGTASAGAS